MTFSKNAYEGEDAQVTGGKYAGPSTVTLSRTDDPTKTDVGIQLTEAVGIGGTFTQGDNTMTLTWGGETSTVTWVLTRVP